MRCSLYSLIIPPFRKNIASPKKLVNFISASQNSNHPLTARITLIDRHASIVPMITAPEPLWVHTHRMTTDRKITPDDPIYDVFGWGNGRSGIEAFIEWDSGIHFENMANMTIRALGKVEYGAYVLWLVPTEKRWFSPWFERDKPRVLRAMKSKVKR